MTAHPPTGQNMIVTPVRAEQWPDLENLFGAHGAYAGCWCMFWRLKRADFKLAKGEERKAMLKALVEDNQVPGVLATVDGAPAGWCAVAPRADYRALATSRILTPIDDQPVWSVVCFFVARPYRKQNLMEKLLQGAVSYAVSQGAQIVEGYPIDMQTPMLIGHKLTGYSGYMGIASAFRGVGFVEAGRASETQLIMRYHAPQAERRNP